MSDLGAKLAEVARQYDDVQAQLVRPETSTDPDAIRRLGRELARLEPVVAQDLIKEPVIFTMAKKFDVMPNIRRARVTENLGEVVLELEGSEKRLEEGIAT